MQLINIYDEMYIHRHYMALYNLLAEREPYQNISHKELPAFPDHVKFVDSKPYMCWYGIWDEYKEFAGAIYIGKDNNIGLFIRKNLTGAGYGKQALQKIMELHPLPYYLANIAPENSNSIAFFSNFGFKHFETLLEDAGNEVIVPKECIIVTNSESYKIIQYTYKFTPSVEKA